MTEFSNVNVTLLLIQLHLMFVFHQGTAFCIKYIDSDPRLPHRSHIDLFAKGKEITHGKELGIRRTIASSCLYFSYLLTTTLFCLPSRTGK
jgi:hypothetical protein